MDDLRTLLFDPAAARRLVLARRPAGRAVVADVVSDVVWTDVVRLLRWAVAAPHAAPGVRAGAWWRLAAGCADLLRRLPALGDEVAEHWAGTDGHPVWADDLPARQRVRRATDLLAAALLAAEPPDLRGVAARVDALGAAAVAALVEGAVHRLPRGRS